MASKVHKVIRDYDLINKGKCPNFVHYNLHYEVLTGSNAYGMAQDDSDWDVVGFCIPYQDVVFPHLRGEIHGFGKKAKRFDQWQAHHIQDKDRKEREYDFTVYSIVKFFQLCMENNPNMIDVLFVPDNCVLFQTEIGELVRRNRRIFLHKGCFHKFKGYSYAQMHKMSLKNPQPGGKREALIKEFGYDTKFAVHLVRLLLEVEQILTEGDLDLQRHREQLKAIRRGEWPEERVRRFFAEKEEGLEKVYNECTILPYGPDETAIYNLLSECLEMAYGDNYCMKGLR